MNTSLNENEGIFGADSTLNAVSDSITAELDENIDYESNNETENDDSSEFIINSIDFKSAKNEPNLRSSLNNVAYQLEILLKNEDDTEKRAKLINYIQLCRSPEQALARVLKYLSWAFFLLLPVFALILWLFYIRRNQYYIRHLIFSIHVHSYLFIVFIMLTSVFMIFNTIPGWIVSILLFSIPLYLIIALKKFYGQGILKVILKFMGISFLYNIVFWVTVGIVFFNALNII